MKHIDKEVMASVIKMTRLMLLSGANSFREGVSRCDMYRIHNLLYQHIAMNYK